MKYLTFGEIMLRLKSPGHERLFQSPALEATFGGGEANVAVSLANYGMDAAFLTVLPKNDIADFESMKKMQSQLQNWPVQIKLAPINAPYFSGANLLIAADCTAYAYANFHSEFIKGKIVLIGCPKLDDIDYSEKLTQIIKQNDIKSVTIVRMEVPCCGGLEHAVKSAIQASGKFLPWRVVTISIDGKILD